ncbi:MAG: xanthine dehydrogenase family protein subunit M [bacterium]|nr:xanthine dehydrogenase family protein subunit M [bacterium]
MKSFDYFAPTTIREAVDILAKYPDAKVLAGGTDLLVHMKLRVRTPDVILDVGRLSGADALTIDRKRGLTIGPAVTMRQVELSQAAWKTYAGFAQGASVVGSIQIRNLATVVGNVCNAAPSADVAPGLIALGAKVRIAGPKGRRSMQVENFMTGPGQTALQQGEFVTGIQVPVPAARTGSAFVRHTPRGAMDIAVVGVGASVTLAARTGACQAARIVMGAVAPTPIRAKKAERMLRGQRLSEELIAKAAEVASGEARPISDVRASADFRRELVRVLTKRMVTAAWEDAMSKTRSKRRAA